MVAILSAKRDASDAELAEQRTPGHPPCLQETLMHLLSRPIRAAAAPAAERLGALVHQTASRAATPGPRAVWRGTLNEGAAVTPDGLLHPHLTEKYRDELTYWRRAADGNEPSFEGGLHDTFGQWQRTRLYELGGRLKLSRPFKPGEPLEGELADWCSRTRALEIGGGPHPAVCEAVWKSAVAVDPLSDGFQAEGLLPPSAEKVTHLCAPGEAIPLAASTIDLVIAENCLDHVVDPWRVLSEIKRLLVPGGHLWLLVDLMHHRDHLHPHPFTEASARQMLTHAGFTFVKADIWEAHSHPMAFGQMRALLRRP